MIAPPAWWYRSQFSQIASFIRFCTKRQERHSSRKVALLWSIVAFVRGYKGLCPRSIRPDLTEINGPFHLPFYTPPAPLCKSYQWRRRRERHNLGVNAKKAKCFGSFPPLMAGHKNNGRTDNSHAICPYIHITEISGNPHVYLHAHTITQIYLLKCEINWQKKTLKFSPPKCGQVKLASPITSKNIQKPETCGFVPGRNLDLFRRSVCIFHPARSVFVAARVDPDPFKKPQFCNAPPHRVHFRNHNNSCGYWT